ncbi:hypothetical protein BgiMline_033260 [Biomphalaria glabrata]|nr:CAunnamed protein product [Biomphalaria glabrata]
MSRADDASLPDDGPLLSIDLVDQDLEDYYHNTTQEHDMAEGAEHIQELLPEDVASRALWIYGSPLIVLIGTVGSILSLLVLCQKSMRTRTTMFYLASLAVSDLMCLYTGLARLWLEHAQNIYIRLTSEASCKLHTFIVYMSLDLSAWILVTVSVDRCLFITWPHRAKTWCTIRNARISVAAVACAVTLLNLHFLWTYQLDGDSVGHIYSNGGKKCYADTSSELTVRFIERVWPWIDLCFYCLFPFLFMLTCDVIIIRQLFQSERVMASHKRRLFFRRKLTSTFKSSPLAKLRIGENARKTPGECSDVGVGFGANRGSLLSTSDTRSEETRLFHRSSSVSDTSLLKTSFKYSNTGSGHLAPVYVIDPTPLNEDAEDQIELFPERNLAVYKAISSAAVQTLLPTDVNQLTGNESTIQREMHLTRCHDSSTSLVSLKSTSELGGKNNFNRKQSIQTLAPLTFPPENFCSDTTCKEVLQFAVSPSSVSTRFTFAADGVDVFPSADDGATKKNPLCISHIRKNISNKVHPMKTCHLNGVCLYTHGGDSEIPEFKLDNWEETKIFSDRPFKAETIGDRPFKEETIVDRPFKEETIGDRQFKEETIGDGPFKGETICNGPFQAKTIDDRPFKGESSGDGPFKGEPTGDGSFKKEIIGDKIRASIEKVNNRHSQRLSIESAYIPLTRTEGNESELSELSRHQRAKLSGNFSENSATSQISRKSHSLRSEGQQSSRRTTSSVSKTLLAVTITFWALNAPIVIFIIGYTYWSKVIDDRKHARLSLAWAVVNCLQYSNNSIHFFLYCLTAPRFRRELCKLLGFLTRSGRNIPK